MLTCDRSQARQYGDEQGRYWSVSQVCEAVTGDRGFMNPEALQRGTDVHLIFSLAVGHAQGWCNLPTVPAVYDGYYRVIMEWIEEFQPKPLSLEKQIKHASLCYAGRTDFVGMIGEEFGIVDLKTGPSEKWHRLQLHGYQKAIDRAAKMWTLHIDNGVSKRMHPIKYSARDWAAFQNGLSILKWREAA